MLFDAVQAGQFSVCSTGLVSQVVLWDCNTECTAALPLALAPGIALPLRCPPLSLTSVSQAIPFHPPRFSLLGTSLLSLLKGPLVPYSVSFYRHHSLTATLPLTASLSFPATTIFMFMQDNTMLKKIPAKLCHNPLVLCGLQNATIHVNFR